MGEDKAERQPQEHHDRIYAILQNQDEITWQSILLELIKTEEMDPWDINISILAKKYIQTLKKLKEMNLRLSGKVLLAAALLLRIKSAKLVGEDLMEFDRLLASGNSDDLYGEEQFLEGELEGKGLTYPGMGDWKLIPRTPQPRKRKVSVYDLIDALAVALNVRRRRILGQIQQRDVQFLPDSKYDISKLMDELYLDVVQYLASSSTQKVAFSDLVKGGGSQEKVLTFIPLLHLTTERKTDLEQHNHFGEIWVSRAGEFKKADDDSGIPHEVKRLRKAADPNAPKRPRKKKDAPAAAQPAAPAEKADASPPAVGEEAVSDV